MATTETYEGRSGSKLLGNLDHLRERSLEGLKELRRGNNVNVGKLERVASVLGGAALAAWALKRWSKGTMGLALAGLPLVWRGATGHCPVYDRMGIDRVHGNGKSEGLRDASTEAAAPGGLLGQNQSF